MGTAPIKLVQGFRAALALLFFLEAPLTRAHWPDQAPHQFADLGAFCFEGGGVKKELKA